MPVFSVAENLVAYAKIGLYGLAGSGKTTTAMHFAVGLSGEEKKPIFFLDTETGSDFFVERMKKLGIPFHQSKSRTFAQVEVAIEEAEKAGAILIIDSISHFWDEIQDAFLRRTRQQIIRFQDWGEIKRQWKAHLALPLVNSKCHTIICGRQQDIYDIDFSGDRKEIVKTGDRMGAEKNLAHEPHLVMRMDARQATPEKIKQAAKGKKVNSKMLIEATVTKDRADILNGKVITFPTFEDILPHLAEINIGGRHVGVDTSITSEALFHDADEALHDAMRRRGIALDEFKEEVKVALPGRTDAVNAIKSDLLAGLFGTRSWKSVEESKGRVAEAGLRALRMLIKDGILAKALTEEVDVVAAAEEAMRKATEEEDLGMEMPEIVKLKAREIGEDI